MRLFLYFSVIVVMTIIESSAQTDSPFVQLPLVEVREQKLSSTQNQIFTSQGDRKDILLLEHNVPNLIQLYSGGFLRDHGNKTLGTLSIRGGSSQQTKVLWNGADISNPMLGLSDISMLPSFFFNEIAINSTNADAVYNPIGGALQLNSKLEDSSDYALGYSTGDFGFHQAYFNGQVNVHPKFSIGMSTFVISEEQNFLYKEEHKSVLLPDRQPHALHLQNGFLGKAKYTVNVVHEVKVSTWLQSLQREIPPLRTQRNSTAVQSDTVIRSQIEWSSKWDHYQQSTLLTLRNESNVYRDPRNGIDDQNEFNAHQLISKHKLILNEQFFTKFGLNANWYQVSSPNYENKSVKTSRFHLYFNPVYVLSSIPLQFDFALRYNFNGNDPAPVTGHAKALWIHRNHYFSLGFIRAHRFPSLNDLYWVPAGNLNLDSELSHQWNIGYQFDYTAEGFKVKTQANLFYKNVNNWILWAPVDQFIWAPENILRVTSLGFDINQKMNWQIGSKQSLHAQLNFLYQSVKNTGSQHTPLAQKDKNLIYMPEFKFGGNLSWQFHDFTFMYLHQWRSKIYTNPDLSEKLLPLSLGQFRFSYSIKIFNQKIQMFVRSHNLWNTSYFYQPDLPAPGIRWRAGLLIQKL